MSMKLLVTVVSLALAGCASFDGRGLMPGKSTEQDVVALMGAPADRIKLQGGDTVLYYPRQPEGRMSYAAHLGPDGVLRSVDQLLTEPNIANLVRGTTTRAQARAILGPPWRTTRLERQQREVWEYKMYNQVQDKFFLYVQLSDDGIVQEVLMIKDYVDEPGGQGFF
ncbi:MAG TPA: hypothetical protein VMJ14_01335 [Burkholderiales bacterium]|nr:hypothetical protein [Burkholderiales bacterium]